MTMIKCILLCILIFVCGFVFHILCSKTSEKDPPVKSGTIVIRKDDEAIDGQVQFTRDLWDISTHKEITLKIKVIPGEPGDWEEKKNG